MLIALVAVSMGKDVTTLLSDAFSTDTPSGYFASRLAVAASLIADPPVILSLNTGGEPAETYRGVGVIYRQRNQAAAARENFRHYLESAPQAPDSAMIKSYLEDAGT